MAKIKRVLFLLRITYCYAIFKMMRDLCKNHISDKDPCEFAEYLEVVYLFKIKNILEKESKKFFGDEIEYD